MKLSVSFKESERYLYEYVISKRSFSCYIKDLIEEDLNKTLANNNNHKN